MAASASQVMDDENPGEPIEYTRDGTACAASELREPNAYIARGGLIRVEGENQSIRKTVILRQYAPMRKQTTEVGVRLAATLRTKNEMFRWRWKSKVYTPSM